MRKITSYPGCLWVEEIIADGPIELVDGVRQEARLGAPRFLDKLGLTWDCRSVSEVLSDVLDRKILSWPYSLDFISGLAPLKRNLIMCALQAGWQHCTQAINGQKNFQGTLMGIEDGKVLIEIDGKLLQSLDMISSTFGCGVLMGGSGRMNRVVQSP